MNLKSEQRSNPRTAMHEVVRFERSALGAGRQEVTLGFGKGKDIGAGGAGLMTETILRQGEILKLHIPILANSGTVPVFSEVRWIQDVPEGCKAGLRFLV